MNQDRPFSLTVCLLGIGEAGQSIGSDLLARGVAVTGWDPNPTRRLAGATHASSAAEAVSGSDVVLSLNSAKAALDAATQAAPHLAPGQLYADLNSASNALKLAVAEVIAPTGAAFADVALMDTVPGRGLATRCLASGSGADLFAHTFTALGTPVEAIGPEPGSAASRKLLRSVFMKGLAAAAVEAVRASEAAGCESWLRAEISRTLATANASLLDRLIDGSRRHAARRVTEMQDARDLLRTLGVDPHITESTIASLQDLAQRQRFVDPDRGRAGESVV